MQKSDYLRFIVVAPFRSGSTLLTERLNAHPDVHCYGELLNRTQLIWHPMPEEQHTGLEDMRASDPAAFLDTVAWRPRAAPVRAVGFKLPEPQFYRRLADLKAYFATMTDLHVIYLSRENLLARYASERRAQDSKTWFMFNNAQRPKAAPMTLDAKRLEDFFRTEPLLPMALKATLQGCAAIDLTYETMISEPLETHRRLCAFLGLDYHPPKDASQKIGTAPLAQQIANFEELSAHFSDTPWAQFFNIRSD